MNPTSCDCIFCALCEGKYSFTVPFSQALPIATMLCVCENVHPATREWDVLSWVSHTAQSVSSTQPNVCVDPSARMKRYRGHRWSSLKHSSFHSLRDTTKGKNVCYPNEKQNTAVVKWHLFSRSQASQPTCRFAHKDITLTFRHHASSIYGQTFHYSPENAFYIFNKQIYFII